MGEKGLMQDQAAQSAPTPTTQEKKKDPSLGASTKDLLKDSPGTFQDDHALHWGLGDGQSSGPAAQVNQPQPSMDELENRAAGSKRMRENYERTKQAQLADQVGQDIKDAAEHTQAAQKPDASKSDKAMKPDAQPPGDSGTAVRGVTGDQEPPDKGPIQRG